MKRIFASLLCLFVAASCSDNDKPGIRPETITLNKTTLLLGIGKSETLTATVTPENATDKRVEWSSDNTAAVTVDDGVVTAVADGVAVITAKTTGGGLAATCSVTATSAVAVSTMEEFQTALDQAAGTAAAPAKILMTADIPVYLNIRGDENTRKYIGIDGGGHTLSYLNVYTNEIIMNIYYRASVKLTNMKIDGIAEKEWSNPIFYLNFGADPDADNHLVLGNGVEITNANASAVVNIGAGCSATMERGAAIRNCRSRAIVKHSSGLFIYNGGALQNAPTTIYFTYRDDFIPMQLAAAPEDDWTLNVQSGKPGDFDGNKFPATPVVLMQGKDYTLTAQDLDKLSLVDIYFSESRDVADYELTLDTGANAILIRMKADK